MSQRELAGMSAKRHHDRALIRGPKPFGSFLFCAEWSRTTPRPHRSARLQPADRHCVCIGPRIDAGNGELFKHVTTLSVPRVGVVMAEAGGVRPPSTPEMMRTTNGELEAV